MRIMRCISIWIWSHAVTAARSANRQIWEVLAGSSQEQRRNSASSVNAGADLSFTVDD
jgi:hypothetical protein